MSINLSGKKVLMVVAPSNFRDEELFDTKEVLEGYGASITIASIGSSRAGGMLGREIKVDIDISQAKADNFDAVVFVGGSGASVYFDNGKAHELAKEMHVLDKVVSAICVASSTLANAGILKGKKATSFHSEEYNLKEKGAIYTGFPITQDGKIITASGPKAAREFGEAIAAELAD